MVGIKKGPMGVDKDLATRIAALDGAGEIELSMLAAAAEAKLIVYSAGGVATAVAMSGDATIAATGAISLAADSVDSAEIKSNAVGSAELADNAVDQAAVADDAIGAAELKVVERNITIAGGAASGTVTTAADANGVILGVIPYAACESAIKDVSFTTATGAITVELASAQGAETPATVTAVVLQV